MNILLLTYAVPLPRDSGPKDKTYHLLRHLAARHRVTLVSFTRTGDRAADIADLRQICADVHTVPITVGRQHDYRSLAMSLFSGRPHSVERNSSAAMRALLARLIAESEAAAAPFDLVHADQLHMAPYAEPLPLPRLLDAHRAIYRIYESLAGQQNWPQNWLTRREAALLRAHEGWLCSTFEAVTTVDDEDRQALMKVMPHPRELTAIPFAVDYAAIQPIRRDPASQAVLSLATPSCPPNAAGIRWFARDVYPLVRRVAPASQLLICGSQPDLDLRAMPERDPSIEVMCSIGPADNIARSACMIVPLLQRGDVRVMILEALAREIPIVSTSAGIVGLNLCPGKHVLVADTSSDFADAVALLLREPELGQQIAAAGRLAAIERHGWRAASAAVNAVYERITAVPGRLDRGRRDAVWAVEGATPGRAGPSGSRKMRRVGWIADDAPGRWDRG